MVRSNPDWATLALGKWRDTPNRSVLMVEKSSSCWRVLRAFMASTSLVVEEAWVVDVVTANFAATELIPPSRTRETSRMMA